MICENYQELSPLEKTMFIGQLVHAAMSHNNLFNMCQDIIQLAHMKGCFEGVEFLPETKLQLEDVL